METQTRTYGKTSLAVVYPWGLFQRRGTRLLCSDGKVRAPSRLSSTPDTFFSTPAGMKINGKYVSGYMTTEESGDMKVFSFRHHTIHSDKLPSWPASFTPEYDNLVKQGHA